MVGVIITLATFIIAVTKPLISLTKAITELTVAVDNLQKDTDEQKEKAKDSHKRIWEHNTQQDKRIDKTEQELIRHDNRISNLEKKEG